MNRVQPVPLAPSHAAAANGRRRIFFQYDPFADIQQRGGFGSDLDSVMGYVFDFADLPGSQPDAICIDVSDEGVAHYRSKMLRPIQHPGLAEWRGQGIDYFDELIKHGHRRGKDIWWGLRMNEVERGDLAGYEPGRYADLSGFPRPTEPIAVPKRRGQLLYESLMDCPESLGGWVAEGPLDLRFEDGHVLMRAKAFEGNTVFWCPQDFPDSFVAEWQFYRVGGGPVAIAPGAQGWQHVRLIKDGNRIQLACNGRTFVDWTDDNPERYGPPHRDGKIGLRQTTPTIGPYRNFRVWALTDERR